MAYVTLTFAKRVKTPWPTFQYFCSSMPTTWPRTFIFGRMADVREPTQSIFWPTLAYFCVCDTRLYDISKIIRISKAITTTVNPPSKLIDFEMLLTSSPTNMTLTLWKSYKADLWVWPNRCTHSHPDGLGLLSSQWHTFKEKKTLKAHISEVITATATLSCTFMTGLSV